MTLSNVNLCFGIDPNPSISSFENFKNCVENHVNALKELKPYITNKFLKLNLAFFLSYGHKGIELLEQFAHQFKDEFTIILDGKFNEIANSLEAYLNFVFTTLGVHGVTINPFLGENTLRLAFETCVKKVGAKGRVYVLCVTSESSVSTLAYLQENWVNKLIACSQIRNEVFGNNTELKKCAGVVIGANKENILYSQEVKDSELSILSPGLGTQGGSFNMLGKCTKFKNDFVFPISRSIFEGGNLDPMRIKENFFNIYKYFSPQENNNDNN